MGYRTQSEIIKGIIESSKSPINKTNLKYQADLSSREVRTYIPLVISRGYVAYDENSRLYQATQEGLTYLERSKRFAEIMSRTFSKIDKS